MTALGGVRVVDLTHAFAGPMCTHQLQMLGADVIKIEPRDVGDDFRARGAVFLALNAGKRSVTLDLTSPVGRTILLKLVTSADVLVENYRPGVTTKLGISYEDLRDVNPRLVYCSISGFGQNGALRNFPAIEWSVQAMSGMTSSYITEEMDRRHLGLLALDPVSGLVGFAGVLAALLRRRETGQGQHVDVSMLDVAMTLMSGAVATHLESAPPGGSAAGPRATMARFRAKDRTLFIGALHDKWFLSLCRILDAPDLAADPRFADAASRQRNTDALSAELNERVATRNAEELEAKCVAAGMPASVVRTIGEIVVHPHVRDRGILQRVPSTDGADITLVGTPYQFAHDGPAFQGPVPRLGQHTDEVLRELGYDTSEVDRLRADGVV